VKTFLPPLVFIAIAIVISIFAHKKFLLKNPDYFLLISIIAGAVSSLIFQIIGYFVLGHLDPFAIIGFATGAVVATVVSVLVGLVSRSINKNQSIQTN
jgi:hypothetical protein